MLVAGCGEEGRIKPETIEVKEDTPLKRATTLLQSYAKGQALGSEVESFPSLVGDLRATDAQRADVLEKGLEELKKTKGPATAAKAKEILARLAPKQTG
jgi:hypothetical protein